MYVCVCVCARVSPPDGSPTHPDLIVVGSLLFGLYHPAPPVTPPQSRPPRVRLTPRGYTEDLSLRCVRFLCLDGRLSERVVCGRGGARSGTFSSVVVLDGRPPTVVRHFLGV